jgi:hypothetical protein
MIHEMREYTLDCANAQAYLDLFRDVGMPIRGNDFGRLVGNWTVDGENVKFVHIWEYDSLADRAAKRATLGQNREWAGQFLPEAVRRISIQTITILNPVGGQILAVPSHVPESNGRVLHAYRCKPGSAQRVAAALSGGAHARADGIWIGEFPDPNAVVVLDGNADVVGDTAELDELGVIYAATKRISAGPYQ